MQTIQINTMLTYATGTLKDPIMVKSFGDEHYIGCTGVPADTHHQLWMVVTRERPIERCTECGNVIKMEYVGPAEDPHAHDHHGHDEHTWQGEPKTMADFVRPEYR
jgi:cytochrome c oxidase subunit 5b